jgi:hypothetical protein
MSPMSGSWAGQYQAEPYRIEMDKKEALPAWNQDDKKNGVGAGRLELIVGEAQSVRGTSTGPFGSLTVTGQVEENRLAAVVSPQDPTIQGGFRGVLLAQFDGEKAKGHLQVSSADSTVVRTAKVELSRGR